MTDPQFFTYAHVILVDGQRIEVRETLAPAGVQISSTPTTRQTITISMTREVAAKLLADLSAVVTLSDMTETAAPL